MNFFKANLKRLFLSNIFFQSEVIRAFQLPVKIMLTTQDSSIMDVINKDCYNLIDCQEGFSEKESLGFFSSTLKVNLRFHIAIVSDKVGLCI